ncbi:hypothetical protein ACHAP7_011012 [Fusarium lateritium]
MPFRSLYLAKSGGGANRRSHFGLFIPNVECDRANLGLNFKSQRTCGTILHVVGEPIMAGFVFGIKRNYDGEDSDGWKSLTLLGEIDVANIHTPPPSKSMTREYVPRSVVENHAASVTPPPRGQNVRAPIDGVTTKRCQEWTMEVLTLLAEKHLISEEAVSIAQDERDPPTMGIFGYKN